MSDEISAAFELNKDRIRKIELKLDSGGGSVKEGEKAIAVLAWIAEVKTQHLSDEHRRGVTPSAAAEHSQKAGN